MKSHADLDRLVGTWETDTGSTLDFIVYDKMSEGVIKPYPIITGTNGSIIGTEALERPLTLESIVQTIGTIEPGIWTSHNGRKFTTIDNDNDDYSVNCSDLYGDTPWWYNSCWSGSINGGGGDGYTDGAYWTGSSTVINTVNGTGGGNGYMFIR